MATQQVPVDHGRRGELFAGSFLATRGCRIIEVNAIVDADEIDIVMVDGIDTVAVEVKTTMRGDDPVEAVDEAKFQRMSRAASGYRRPVSRLDVVAVYGSPDRIGIRWLIGVE